MKGNISKIRGVSIVLPLPPTKNRKFLVSNGRMILSNEVREFYEYCEMYRLEHYQEIDLLLSLWDKDMLRIFIEYFIKNMRRDTSNLIPVLLDGLKRILGIDDRYFLLTELKKNKSIDEKVNVFVRFDEDDEKNQKMKEFNL